MKPMLLRRFLHFLTAAALILGTGACGSDPKDNPDTPVGPDTPDTPNVDPDKPVEDPLGTISLSMRDSDNGHTKLDDIYIKTENFCASSGYVMFSSVGAVNGLGNVSYIPTNGWTDKIKVTPGEGYVAYDGYRNKYYRIYVVSYIVSTTGGIIGADIKYQEPFKGVDEEIMLTETALSFGEEGGSQALFFDNSHLLVYDVASDAPWCKVEKATNLPTPFLYNGVVIKVDKTPTPAATANVTITTAFGKTKEIHVSYAGYEPYVTLGDTSALQDVGYEGEEYRIGLTTNCLETVQLAASDYWIQPELRNESEQMRRKAARLTYVAGKPKTRAESYNDAQDVMTLVVNVNRNDYTDPRQGSVTVNYVAGSPTFEVKQKGYSYLQYNGDHSYSIPAKGFYDYYTFGFSTSYPIEEIEMEVNYGGEAWFDASMERHYIKIGNVQVNTSETQREASITLKTKDGLHSLVYSLTQEGAVYNVSVDGLYNGAYYVDRKAATYSLAVSTNADGLTFTSSAPEWVTATYTAGNVVLRFKAATEDRKATITCSDSRGTFEVHQSKYAVDDNYSESKIEGKVYKMVNGTGFIYKKLNGSYAWSTENIVTGCRDDGKKNMEIIKSFPDWQTLYPAFAAVDALNTDGVTGWYMPAKNWNSIEGWTSTEANATYAYAYEQPYPWWTFDKQRHKVVHAVHEFTW